MHNLLLFFLFNFSRPINWKKFEGAVLRVEWPAVDIEGTKPKNKQPIL